ncbi:ABC transporter permease [Rhizobium sp. R72]|uniref:DMT family transporter n=1 Tax=unclassified Rhizobium TaxID=2613769 RepID=UPI000B52E490|nr:MULTISPECIES: DMT family transporter [unclassified Rhizobium]OWW04490.1 ABC transporter permease [Rhizobium sp. R72]OWW05547.1 ABC transporter permease [Rhizobium sp. R711]
MISRERTLLAASLMVLAAVLNSLDAVVVRSLAGEVHPLMIGFFRSFFGLLVILPWMVSRVTLRASPYRFWHVVRASLKLASLISLFIAFAHAPLADATAINFTMPVFLVLGAWLFLKERVGLATITSIVAGFIGIVLIIKPGSASFDPWLLFALAGAILTAASQLILRRMALSDSTDQLVAWNLLVTVPLAFLAMLPVLAVPTMPLIGLLALQGAIGAVNMSIITRAFGRASASFLAPFDFLRLPIVAALAFVFFGEQATVATWTGGAVIFGATLVATGGARFLRR